MQVKSFVFVLTFFFLNSSRVESCFFEFKTKKDSSDIYHFLRSTPTSLFSLFKPYNDKSLLFYFPATQNDFFPFLKLILLINKADNLSACFGTERFIFTKNGKKGEKRKKKIETVKVEKKKKKNMTAISNEQIFRKVRI